MVISRLCKLEIVHCAVSRYSKKKKKKEMVLLNEITMLTVIRL